ncbi:MAG: AsnC family transcriptional regulator [Thermoproteota archaeon]|nr:AsnC family transcriptional regulator [Nitrosopumilus sp.]MDQ3084708.1 AsnC family transcriptional regulator [Thermoproteota archaeon]
MPRRVKRFDVGKISTSNQNNVNGDSIAKVKSGIKDLLINDKIDILSNADFNDPDSSAVHLDKINLKIMEELLNNGDIKSSEIALKLGIPLSTIQRRRSMLEKFSVLKKTYSLDPKKLGLRISEVSISTKKGSSQKVMNEIYKGHRKNIIDMSLRMGNPDTNVSFRIVYKHSVHLFSLLEEIKANPLVDKVSWSEYITEIKNNPAYFSNLFSL